MIYYYGAAVGYPDAASFPAGKCIPMPTYLEIPIIASFITDVFLFLLPLIPLWNMQLPMVKKVSVFLTLSLGLFAIGIDVVRIREIVHFDRFDDATYRNIGGVAWNAIEYNVAMVSACIPAMAPLLRRDLWKRGARARSQKQAAIQLDDDNATFYKSERNLLGPSPIYFASDYQIWGDRSEQWRDQTRRPSEASTWSGATRSGSIATAAEKERQRQESLSSSVGGRRISDTATITELYQMPSSAADYPHPTKNAEWI